MKTYRFAEFQAEAVASGAKRRTIRAANRRHAAPGEALRLTGGRYRPRLLREAVCEAAVPVAMTVTEGRVTAAAVDGVAVEDVDAFARQDGFVDAGHMGREFARWHGEGEFRGVMVVW